MARPTVKPDLSARELGLAKLALSDLDLQDAQRLGIEFLSAAQVDDLGFEKLPALKINYFDPAGRPLSDWPKRPPFYRLRYLAEKNDFKKFTDAKPQRYTQPPDSVCCAYFPKGTDWRVLLDPEQPLIITEGELKAACACRYGFDTIGLGGVYNWRALRQGLVMLPELEGIKWAGRRVYLAFDSDYLTNPMVCAALGELGDMLVDRGAFCKLVTLPSVGDQKTGLDDFLVTQGADNFERLLIQAPPLGLTKVLFKLNDKYIYVQDPGLVIKPSKRGLARISPGAFTEHVESTKTYQEYKLKPDGELSHHPVSASKAWLGWPLRHQVAGLTYAPGEKDHTADHCYNVWPGWACEPAKGSVKPFTQLLDHLFTGAEPQAREWFERWLAYPIQKPGTKLFTSTVFHGIRHGTGKSLVGYTMGRIYGKNYVEITQADLHASFNEWAEAKQFVLGDDVTGSNKRQDADLLKKLITQKEMRVNVKYVPSYTVPDCINYLFTSNHPDAFFLEDDDRRFFIHEVQVGPLSDEFYQSYIAWLDGPGAAALFAHLLALPLKGFNPAAAALKTQARDRLISDVQSDLGTWVRELRANPDQVLKVGSVVVPHDLFTARELLNFYDPAGQGKVTANGLGRELRRAGLMQVAGGLPIRLSSGDQGRYHAVRNVDRWLKASVADCVKHLEVALAPEPPKKKKF